MCYSGDPPDRRDSQICPCVMLASRLSLIGAYQRQMDQETAQSVASVRFLRSFEKLKAMGEGRKDGQGPRLKHLNGNSLYMFAHDCLNSSMHVQSPRPRPCSRTSQHRFFLLISLCPLCCFVLQYPKGRQYLNDEDYLSVLKVSW